MNIFIVQLGIVLIQAVVIHVFLKLVKRKRYDKPIIRAVICAGGAMMLHLVAASTLNSYINLNDPTAVARAASLVVLYACAFPLIRYIMRPGLIFTSITCVVLVATTFGIRIGLTSYQGESAVVAEILNHTDPSLEQISLADNTNLVEAVATVKEGVDAYNALKEDKALAGDLRRGIALFKERKEWMDGLSVEEKASYRTELSQFLKEQGLAEDPSSLAAIRSTNPTNLTQVASLFEHLDKMEAGSVAERSQNIANSLTQMTGNLKDIDMSRTDVSNLQKVSELLAADNTDGAMAEIRRQIKKSGGKNKLAGTMMAALIQTKSGVPTDMLTSDKQDKRGFDFGGLLPFLKDETVVVADTPPELEVQTSLTDAVVEEELLVVSEETHVPITAQLGIVHVPSKEDTLPEWISTVHSLRVNGYVSLGDETVILLDNGTMYHNGDIWQTEHRGHQYRFSIDKVLKNKVHLTGIDRTSITSAQTTDIAQL